MTPKILMPCSLLYAKPVISVWMEYNMDDHANGTCVVHKEPNNEMLDN
jgi:hypothetical protein